MQNISVIVPVYKVEQYLPACLDSILAQTFEDFELILVDDGSPDNCGRICDEYAKKDSRIKVIHQENQGLSGARNTGIEIARGEYITFIDSDDLVTENYLQVLHDALVTQTADLSVCRTCRFEDGKTPNLASKQETNEFQCTCFDHRETCVIMYEGSQEIPVNAWGKLFRTELFREIRFPLGRVHEDQAVVPIICYNVDKVVSVNLKLYCYRERSGSITRDKFSLKRYDDLWAIDTCIQFFESNQEWEIVEAAKSRRYRMICSYAIYAKKEGVSVPEEYRISTIRALRYLKKHVSDEKYEYYLAQINGNLPRVYEYIRKIKQMLGLAR